ncbi:MAG: bifunctional 4-hydroxy-2-oxoglutarate aldolase/2-dehydro-3-deoxy-phosphogluconate aldolase [Bdellovibrionota bacterium]
MKAERVLEVIHDTGIVAILRLPDLTDVVDLCRTLLESGIKALEIPLTNPDALSALRKVRAEISEFSIGRAVIGTGTVLTPEFARQSIEHGAQFVVTPITNLAVIDTCRKESVPNFPGAFTPTEIYTAWEAGASAVKVFPARSLGPNFIKDVREPLPNLRLMPTGGVNVDNIGQYLSSGAYAVGVGGNLMNKEYVAQKNWTAIHEQASAYVRAVKEARS